jgi:glutamate carboxypeptidase
MSNRLSEPEQRLCRAIAQRLDSMVADLAIHVAIPTGRGFRPGLDHYRGILADRLQSLGSSLELIPGDPRPPWIEPPARLSLHEAAADEECDPLPALLARHPLKQSRTRILLSGHIDTVHDPQGSFQSLSIAGDRATATGPGVVDMKGGILIAINALEALAELGVDLHWSFILDSDEETGSFMCDRALRDSARDHDVALALEPALPGGALAVERMGSGQFKVECFGRSAHAGRDFGKGVSAVYALARIITQLESLARPDQGMIVNVGPLVGGELTNAVPDNAACWGNVRFVDNRAADILAKSIESLATMRDDLPRVAVQRIWNRPAKPRTDSSMKLAELAHSVAAELGQPMTFASTGGVCDGNNLQAAGLPTIDTLGVRGGNLHRTDEFIELASLVERCQLLALLMLRLSENRLQGT